MKGNIEERAERELAKVHRFDKTADDRQKLWFSDRTDRFSMAELQTAPKPMRVIIDPILPAGCAAVQTGAGGTSKTGVMSVMGICVAADLPFYGHAVMAGSVLHISAEDRREVFHRHVYANSRDLTDLQIAMIAERLYVKDTVGLGFKLTWSVDGRTRIAEDVGQLIEYAQQIPELRLITLDTLSRLNGGEETNEDLARFVEAMERIARETGAAVLANHHSGKAQMRTDTNDQYAGRGGSALSDNSRSMLHLAKVTMDSTDAPSNATQLIGQGRLLRLSHVKSNYLKAADDIYLERIATPHAAQLKAFEPEFTRGDAKAGWEKIRDWLAIQTDVKHPTARTIDNLGPEFGSRSERRRSIDWAIERGKLLEEKHPEPQGKRQTFYALPSITGAARDYREATDGN